MNTEVDLAKKVIEWLEEQHWDVYQEVMMISGRADIVAVRSGYVWTIETKTSMSFSVINQARVRKTHFKSIAVPVSHNRTELVREILNNFGIGFIEVDDFVRERIRPVLHRDYHKFSKQVIKSLRPEHKYVLSAGSSGGGYLTPYSMTMIDIRRFIGLHPGCTLKEIMDELGKFHYSTIASARCCISKALVNWESEWCDAKQENGKTRYYLRERI
ncbi:hypothetical protein EH221_07395 [bacterium]|nr:MAG: hypothetical protein EH221_07395 [bacterium]